MAQIKIAKADIESAIASLQSNPDWDTIVFDVPEDLTSENTGTTGADALTPFPLHPATLAAADDVAM